MVRRGVRSLTVFCGDSPAGENAERRSSRPVPFHHSSQSLHYGITSFDPPRYPYQPAPGSACTLLAGNLWFLSYRAFPRCAPGDLIWEGLASRKSWWLQQTEVFPKHQSDSCHPGSIIAKELFGAGSLRSVGRRARRLLLHLESTAISGEHDEV